jgi:hypothetical protein
MQRVYLDGPGSAAHHAKGLLRRAQGTPLLPK